MIQDLFWRTADLTGQRLSFRQVATELIPDGYPCRSTCDTVWVAYIKLVPLGACAAEINLLRKRGIGPYFPDFSANRTTMHLKIEKIWPRFPTFSLRSFLRRRLLDPGEVEALQSDRKQTGTRRLFATQDWGSGFAWDATEGAIRDQLEAYRHTDFKRIYWEGAAGVGE